MAITSTLASLATLLGAAEADLVRGVNYGNRFLVEDWMTNVPWKPWGDGPDGKSPFYVGLSRFADRWTMADVVDTDAVSAKDRMMTWLNVSINEADFQIMQDNDVNVIRLPTGYWNWVSYPPGSTPNGPDEMRQSFENLQSMGTPGDYRKFFDRVFEYANNHGIMVQLDLHALPGSQNGEVHSGIITARTEDEAKTAGHQYFASDWNKQKAVEAVGEMAKYGATKPNLHSIEVMNEPHNIDLGFLKGYYEEACGQMRQHLNSQTPCVLFSWTYEMTWWQDNKVDVGTYGTIWYDTHLYQRGSTLVDALSNFWSDYESVRSFDHSTGGIHVGEWSLALHDFDTDEDAKATAAWFVQQFQCFALGTTYWAYDGGWDEWEFKGRPHGVDWPAVWAPRTSTFRSDLAPFSIFTGQAKFLSAAPDGILSSSQSSSQWEQWYAYLYEVDGQQKLALRSWHLKWLAAQPDGSLSASSSDHSQLEEFSVYSYESGGHYRMALQSVHGKWVTVDASGGFSATADDHSACEEFTVAYCDKEVWSELPICLPRVAPEVATEVMMVSGNVITSAPNVTNVINVTTPAPGNVITPAPNVTWPTPVTTKAATTTPAAVTTTPAAVTTTVVTTIAGTVIV